VALTEIFLIAVALAMDAFTVAVAIGLHLSGRGGINPRQYFRLGFHFGLFQFLMPIIGWLAGETISRYIETFDHWIALVLLVYIGVKLIHEGGRADRYSLPDPTRGISLIVLSVATSIDALAVGISMAILGAAIIYPAVIIGLVAGLFTLAGLKLSDRISSRWRTRVAWLGAVILFAIGLKIVIEHTL